MSALRVTKEVGRRNPVLGNTGKPVVVKPVRATAEASRAAPQ